MTIRDLGYKPYEGDRLASRARQMLLTKRSLALAWAPGLVKATMIVGLLPLLVCAVILYFKVKARMMIMGAGGPATADDATNWIYYGIYWCQLWFAFAMSLLVAAPAVAGDVASGAFQFYFARPITRGHYAAAKLVAAGVLVTLVVAIPGLLLAMLRLGLAKDGAEALGLLPYVLSALLFSVVMGLSLTLPALALSALTRKPGYAQGGWSAIFFMPWVLGEGLAASADMPLLALFSLPTCLRLVGQGLFGIERSYDLHILLPVGVVVAILSLSVWTLWSRLSRVEDLA
ncbi:MAG: ABC transporter permease subunit [Deltaproteobacteria bacterium]|nr:ABC transporter permease subunit [Deltaproteobacteria bacterium]